MLTKTFLLDIINRNNIYLEYLPDKVKLENISKQFLFTVSINIIPQLIANLEPVVYGQLYQIYKTKEAQNETKKWEDYEIKLGNDIFEKINSFKPTDKYINII